MEPALEEVTTEPPPGGIPGGGTGSVKEMTDFCPFVTGLLFPLLMLLMAVVVNAGAVFCSSDFLKGRADGCDSFAV